jgi:hypothetical protein
MKVMQVAVQPAPGLYQQVLLRYSFKFGVPVLMAVLVNVVAWVFLAEMLHMQQ